MSWAAAVPIYFLLLICSPQECRLAFASSPPSVLSVLFFAGILAQNPPLFCSSSLPFLLCVESARIRLSRLRQTTRLVSETTLLNCPNADSPFLSAPPLLPHQMLFPLASSLQPLGMTSEPPETKSFATLSLLGPFSSQFFFFHSPPLKQVYIIPVGQSFNGFSYLVQPRLALHCRRPFRDLFPVLRPQVPSPSEASGCGATLSDDPNLNLSGARRAFVIKNVPLSTRRHFSGFHRPPRLRPLPC